MKSWIIFLNSIKEGYKVHRLKVGKIPVSRTSVKLAKLFLSRGFIKGFEIKQYFDRKKKKYLLSIFVDLKYYCNRSIIRDIEIISPTFFGSRYARCALKFKKLKKLGSLNNLIIQTEKGLVFGDVLLMLNSGGFPLCRIIF